MPTAHRAFVFNYEAFADDLAPILYEALESGPLGPLAQFVESNAHRFTDPVDGEPLDELSPDVLHGEWDATRIGRLALTAYYDPGLDLGFGPAWEEAFNEVQRLVAGDVDALVLGSRFGPAINPFGDDHPRAYFRSWETVSHQRQLLASLRRPLLRWDSIGTLAEMLTSADDAEQGLFVEL